MKYFLPTPLMVSLIEMQTLNVINSPCWDLETYGLGCVFALVSLTGAQGLSTAAVVVVLHAKDGWDTSSGAQARRQVGGPRAVGMHVGHIVVLQAAVPMGHLLHKTQKKDILHTIKRINDPSGKCIFKAANGGTLVLFIYVKTKS